jgi:hypothetical protein
MTRHQDGLTERPQEEGKVRELSREKYEKIYYKGGEIYHFVRRFLGLARSSF